jgi:hypothetical protein
MSYRTYELIYNTIYYEYVGIQVSNMLKNNISPSKKKIENLDNNYRIYAIKSFIKNNPYCSESDVIEDAYQNEYASKKTVNNIIKALVKDGVVMKEKERQNSRSCRLSVKENDPLIVIPEQLVRLENLFRIFTEKIINTYSKPHKEWPNLKQSSVPNWTPLNPDQLSSDLSIIKLNPPPTVPPHPYTNERLTIYEIIQIPFAIIDILYAPIKFLQRTIWINYKKNIYENLYNIIFYKISSLNQIALNAFQILFREPYKYHSSYENDEYFITVENKYERYSLLEKICLIRHKCKSIGLLNEIDKILDYLIENHMDYFTIKIPHISPDFKWPNLETPTKTKLEIIHDMCCPGIKSRNKRTCELLDRDPIFTNF